MATATVKSPPHAAAADAGKLTLGEELIALTIAHAQVSLWRAELSRSLLKLVVVGFAIALAWVLVDQWVWSPSAGFRVLAFLACCAAALWWITTRIVPLLRSRVRADYAAQSLELDMPDLRHQLTSYISLREDLSAQGVRGAVVRSIGARAAGQIKQHRIEIPSEAEGVFTWWIVLAVTLALVAGYVVFSPKNTLQSAQRLLLPLASIEAPSRVQIGAVEPGDAEVLSGRPLAISAQITGLAASDQPAVKFGTGLGQHQPLVYDVSSDRFVAALTLQRSTRYHIVAGDAAAGPYEVVVRDVPVASVRQIEITPPRYTGLANRFSTGGAITAEEGSQVVISASVNRVIQKARIEFNPTPTAAAGQTDAAQQKPRIGPSAGSLDMTVAGDGLSATGEVLLRLPREKAAAVAITSYRIRVWDAAGNENPDPITYPVRITPDLPPEITLAAPKELTKEVPINSQQLVEVAALDPDYGLRQIDLSWQRGADPQVSEILWSAASGARGNQVAEYRFRPDALGLRVGDRISVTATAKDNREDSEGRYDPNQTTTMPVQWVIVAPRQLPPATAPEDGLSEPDGEPAGGGQAEQQPGGQPSGDAQGNSGGQSGGSGGESGETGKTDSAGEGSSDEPSDSAEGGKHQTTGQTRPSETKPSDAKPGETKPGDSNPGETAAGEHDPENNNPENDSPGDSGSGENAGQSPAASSPERGTQKGDMQPGGDSQSPEPAGNPGDEPSSGANQGQPSPVSDSPQDQDPAADSQDAAPPTKPMNGQGGGGEPGDAQAPGEQAPSEQAPSEKAPGEQAPGEQAPSEQAPSEQTPGGGEAGAEDRKPPAAPQHDGDAFERIRDFINNQNKPPSDPSSPGDTKATPGDAKPSPGDSKPPAGDTKPAGQEPTGTGEPQSPPDGEAGSQKPETGSADQPMPRGQQGEPGQAPSEKGGESGAADASGSDAGNDPAGQTPPPGKDPGTKQPKPPGEALAGNQPGQDALGGDQGAPASQDSPDQSGKPSDSGKPGDGQDASQPNQAPSSGGGEGDGSSDTAGNSGGDAAGALPPEPVDLEYAKQATDLVLDYLDQNRDTPDPELLERLNWTPEELRDFTQRWQQQLKAQRQESGATDTAGDAKQVEEALKSLGIRPPSQGPIGAKGDRDDALRRLRDAGNRPPAPSIYRDAFEAFRRGVNR